jgi:predicted regulator of Ras-like GTPase activity (Roadblock/LC7/MglB family)
MFQSRKRIEETLTASGSRAEAVVLEAQRTTWTTNVSNKRLWKLRIQVRPQGEAEFEVRVKEWLGGWTAPREGMTLQVLYDPSDHSRVMVDQAAGELALAGATSVLLGNGAAVQLTVQGDPSSVRVLTIGPDGQLVTPQVVDAPSAASPQDRLAKLAQLRDTGVITDQEFQTQQSRILGDG